LVSTRGIFSVGCLYAQEVESLRLLQALRHSVKSFVRLSSLLSHGVKVLRTSFALLRPTGDARTQYGLCLAMP